MIKTCEVCGKQFTTNYPNKKYCSSKCARRAKSKQNGSWNKNERDEKRREWAYKEAEKIAPIVINCIGSSIDNIADYIYNNYNKRSKLR